MSVSVLGTGVVGDAPDVSREMPPMMIPTPRLRWSAHFNCACGTEAVMRLWNVVGLADFNFEVQAAGRS